jgi:hypothetical protein
MVQSFYVKTPSYEKPMWQIKVATALGTVALTGLVGAGVGVGYYVVNADKVTHRVNTK